DTFECTPRSQPLPKLAETLQCIWSPYGAMELTPLHWHPAMNLSQKNFPDDEANQMSQGSLRSRCKCERRESSDVWLLHKD
uniref:Interleukin 12 receptor beta 2 n=1 Tax=Haemonchus contortus TaxID=6289 RepID=A0A7I4YX95_HAECO